MKKRLFLGLLAVAAVSFTACQKDEVISQMPKDQAIEFGTYLGRGAQTKGSVITTTELQTQGFGVYAYYTADADVTAGATISGTPNFMSNVKVYQNDWDSNVATPITWGYTPIKYWPNTNGHKISFYAYGPYDANDDAITLSATDGTKPVLTYTVNENISKHMDVLFTPAQENLLKRNAAIEMPFYHALSRVGFKVQTAAAYSSTVELQSVSLTGKFYTSGTMNLGTASVTTTPALVITPGWNGSGNSTERSFTVTESDVAVTASSRIVGTEGEYIMIIPQVFSGSDKIKLTVNYTVDGVSNSVSSEEMAYTFVAGKAYTFLIKIGLATVDFSANVVAWDDSTPDNEVVIQ